MSGIMPSLIHFYMLFLALIPSQWVYAFLIISRLILVASAFSSPDKSAPNTPVFVDHLLLLLITVLLPAILFYLSWKNNAYSRI